MYDNPSFKIILIGDSGTPSNTQAQERLLSSKSTSTAPSKTNTRSQSGWTSTQKLSPSTISPSSCKYGIQYIHSYSSVVRMSTSQSPIAFIEEPQQSSWSMPSTTRPVSTTWDSGWQISTRRAAKMLFFFW